VTHPGTNTPRTIFLHTSPRPQPGGIDIEDTMNRENLNRVEKFMVGLFGVFAALVVVPGLVLVVISLTSAGAIDLPH
jgi:hypothetical protein